MEGYLAMKVPAGCTLLRVSTDTTYQEVNRTVAMPLRKERLTKGNLRRHIDEHKIIFEGPVPPNRWPAEHAHLFRVVRDIWANRYDDYRKRTDIDRRPLGEQKRMVKNLCRSASLLRKDIGLNEDTWRNSIETSVIRRFTEEVVCGHCRNENWRPEYEAKPFNEEERAKLERKRDSRRQCRCYDTSECDRRANDDSDEEHHTSIFNHAAGELVSHDPEDVLEDSGFSMHPDRVVGLSMTDRYQRYIESCPDGLTHFPVKKMQQLLYPFLVIEAKRENDAPGFRAVEAQTAFPIRRFLKVQDKLRTVRQVNLDPLVWFLAFQGDEWRLYAGTLDEDKHVHVYDLWLGTIESQDGALQIFQIVDFIWTWARDVYRPQIRRCLAGPVALPNPRAISPTSTIPPFSRSQSVFSESSARSFSQPLLDSLREYNPTAIAAGKTEPMKFPDASSHPFLRWANHCGDRGSIRRADIVQFSFRIFEIPENEETSRYLIRFAGPGHTDSANIWLLRELLQQNRYAFPLRRRHINNMEKCWTGLTRATSHERVNTNPDEIVRAFVFFQTFCQPHNWQITREMYCIIWSSHAARLWGSLLKTDVDDRFGEDNLQPDQHAQLFQGFQHLRSLSGKQSVAFALGNISLVFSFFYDLSDGTEMLQAQKMWILEPTIEQYFTIFSFASCGGDVLQRYYHQNAKLLQVPRTEPVTGHLAHLLPIPNDIGNSGAMLAVRPHTWPDNCPQFCLFVLIEQDLDGEAGLGRLLRKTIEARDFYACEDDATDRELLSTSDKRTLVSWTNTFTRG